MQQEPPFCVQIELVEGCNLRCSFCGLNGIRGKNNDFKFMRLSHAVTVANRIKQVGWHPRIEFAMHGEPSLNPELVPILTAFREVLGGLVHLMMTSNGALFANEPDKVDAVLGCLNVLALDWYENTDLVPRTLAGYKGAKVPRYYPADLTASPHTRRKASEHDWVIVKDIRKANAGTHATLNNHAGAGAPKNNNAQGKRCAKPFRELSIRWDGSVAVCCNDWRGEYKVGNVLRQTLERIWNGEEMQAARAKLYHGQRDFGPCNGCDALSYRPGLLPDKKGKRSVPLPTVEDEQVIARCLAGSTFTLPVLRPWERKTP